MGFPLTPRTAPFPTATAAASPGAAQGPSRAPRRLHHREKSLARNPARSLSPMPPLRSNRPCPSTVPIRLQPAATVRARFASSVLRPASAARADRTTPSRSLSRRPNRRRCPSAFRPLHRAAALRTDHPRFTANRHRPSTDVYAGSTKTTDTPHRRARRSTASASSTYGTVLRYRLNERLVSPW